MLGQIIVLCSYKNYFCINFEINHNNELKIIPIQDYLTSSSFIDISDKIIKGTTRKGQALKNIEINLNFGNDTAPYKIDIRNQIKGRFEDLEGGNSYPLPLPELDDMGMYHDFDGPFLSFWIYAFNEFGAKTFIPSSSETARYHSYFQQKTDVQYRHSFNTDFGFLKGWTNSTIELQGNSNIHTEITPSELKLLIYTKIGVEPGHNRVFTPSAVNFHVGRLPTSEYIGLSLDMWGLKSVRRKYWDVFINWFGNIPYKLTKKIDFSLADIKNFDFTKKYKIDNQLFFVENMKITIDIQGNIKSAICVLLPTS